MPCRATQDGWVMVEIPDKHGQLEKGMANHFSIKNTENPMNSMKRQKEMTREDELPRLVAAQYATGDQWRHNSRKIEKAEPKQKQHPVVNGTGDGSRV